MIKGKPINYTMNDLGVAILQALDYLITTHPDPKDGTCHKVHLPLCAEIIQSQLENIYQMVKQMMEITIIQCTFG